MIDLAIVPRETAGRLDTLKALILAESRRQNLISAATVAEFDQRHMADSLQLLDHLPEQGELLDIGSGGGFPGLILAAIRTDTIHLVEPRRKRAEFLADAAASVGMAHVQVHQSKVERVALKHPVRAITARAVASLDTLFEIASHLADEKTRWVLPKGRTASSELEEVRKTWQGEFRLVPSITDSEAAIVIAEGVRRRRSR